ncbi:MAG: NADH-quinone oxidoreductase subunit L [Anaerolineales bacterium]
MAAILVLLTIGLPWIGALFVLLTGNERPKLQHAIASIFSVSAGISAIALLWFTSDQSVLSIPMGSVFGVFTFVPDALGVLLAVIANTVGSLAVIFSIDYMKGNEQLGRYYALVMFFIGAMAGLGISGSLLLMFLFWEITAFCSYALISFHNDDPKAVAAGIKALIITQLGGIGLLVGALIINSYVGSYQISTFLARADGLPFNILTLLAFCFLAAAIAKSAQVPLHTWLPDAMEAPTPVSALIHAATMVNAGVYLVARFFPAFEVVPGWTTSVLTVGMLSALLGALMALVAADLKRVLAYSTISQLGYMFFAVGVGAAFASQFHLLSHAIFKALLFLCAGAVIPAVGTRDMRQMGGLRKTMPFVFTVFAIGSLALVGLPIANGFFSKELILEEGFRHGPEWAYFGMLLGVGLTALYVSRMVFMVFYGERKGKEPIHDALFWMRVSLASLSMGVFTTWLLAGVLSDLMVQTLPFHGVHVIGAFELAKEIALAPATWVSIAVIVLGIEIWVLRKHLSGIKTSLRPVTRLLESGLGFEHLNRGLINVTKNISTALHLTQTGQLNWNILGIVGMLSVLLALVLIGV